MYISRLPRIFNRHKRILKTYVFKKNRPKWIVNTYNFFLDLESKGSNYVLKSDPYDKYFPNILGC